MRTAKARELSFTYMLDGYKKDCSLLASPMAASLYPHLARPMAIQLAHGMRTLHLPAYPVPETLFLLLH